MKAKQKPMPRMGLSIRDRVIAKEGTSYAGYGMGFIIEFLDDPSAGNNGAALVLFHQHPTWGMVECGIRPYINTDELTKVK